MKKVLYITSKIVPYRVSFFNLLAEKCELTVIYEKPHFGDRNKAWCCSEEIQHRYRFLTEEEKHSVASFARLLKLCWHDYDAVIFGCCNSKVQLAAMTVMRFCGKNYYLNFDGELFAEGRTIKSKLKRFFVRGACGYFCAGEVSAEKIRKFVKAPTYSYYFSSLDNRVIQQHSSDVQNANSGDTILVVGQYFDYKGMDIALKTARMDSSFLYKFVGMGSRTELFVKEHIIPENVTVIPFLQKVNLEKEYRNAAMLLLPSRQECWGLVVNEAASFGLPIVSTWGSGAAVEFLSEQYPQFLAIPGDPVSLFSVVKKCRSLDLKTLEAYKKYLLEKSQDYSIEKSVDAHIAALETMAR